MSDKLKKYEKIDRAAVKITYGAAVSILAALLVWGLFLMVNFWKYEETNDAQVKEYINPILSRASGYVQEIRFNDHQKIQKGDTLLVLDIEEANVKLLEAKAALTTAKARLKVLQSNVKTSSGSSSISHAKISAAKAQLWQQQQEFARYQKLLEGEAVTQQQFENVKTKLEVAESNYQAIQNSFSVSQDKTQDVTAEVAVAKANIEQKKAALERINLEIKYAVITAPSDGTMGNKSLQQGQYIQKGQTIGFMVDKKQGKWIVANFEETQIAKMKEGQEAKITIDAFPNKSFHGKIESFSPATGSQFSLLPTDNATGNFVKITQRFPVRIQFTDNDALLEKLRAGMNAEVSIPKK
ncbi:MULTISPECIES: HlyD family secretion protein [Labilibaculum]|uniref:HlyD family efflux transporter periplasmic adaptor subunit n=1 Tax=Labilibaculum euxinus TaxID=2686357 RepID=A0A7M4D2Y2_9BACT|nr:MULTISPECIES: HlyD family secretion protein [Labilibaculum]MUP37011.1 HlyD family efflux transporter periplasmic adaptor subunit [Labilibaculum euxinus]MVB06216.1 HlyD family efflux transporter periplasmic adaptor subunit [Labilibaculum euxinus]